MVNVIDPPIGERTPSESADNVRFLYDKRLTLLNTRRDHEWKIFFGGITLLAGADAAMLSTRLTLAGWERQAWVLWCSVVFVVVCGYERDLQIRNAADRRAMNALYNRLCDLVGIPADSHIREPANEPPCSPRGVWARYGWAFPWQIILLFSAAVASAYLPFR